MYLIVTDEGKKIFNHFNTLSFNRYDHGSVIFTNDGGQEETFQISYLNFARKMNWFREIQ